MFGVTLFGLFFTPVFYIVVRSLFRKPRNAGSGADEDRCCQNVR